MRDSIGCRNKEIHLSIMFTTTMCLQLRKRRPGPRNQCKGKETIGLHTCNNLVDQGSLRASTRGSYGGRGRGRGRGTVADVFNSLEHFEVYDNEIDLNGFETSIKAAKSTQI